MVSDRDKGVRAAALALLQTLYQLAGPSQTWGLLGKLTSQQQSLIEERFKHREKSSASASLSHSKSPAAPDYAVARCVTALAPSTLSSAGRSTSKALRAKCALHLQAAVVMADLCSRCGC